MTTKEALKYYNWAENIVKKGNPAISAIRRAEKINNLLILRFNEDKADEIIDLVFEHVFYPLDLNKNQ